MMNWLLLGLSLSAIGVYWVKPKRVVRWLRTHATLGSWEWRWSSIARVKQTLSTYQSANAGLQEELAAWHSLIQAAPVGFLKVDEDNQLMFCNAKACQLLGIETGNFEKPRLLLELVRSYELDALIEQTRDLQQICHSEWLLHPVDADFKKLTQQQSHPLRGYGVPLPQACVGVFLESREEAVRLAQQRDRWISDVAHELKTPLTSIRLVAETLMQRVESPARDWIERLLREAIRLGNLVQDLLDLNQLQVQPHARLNIKTVDLARLIQSAWLSLEPLASEKQLQLDYAGPPQLLIQADEARIYRVLLNLLDNGIKYSPPDQIIQVKLGIALHPHDRDSQCVHLQVIDAGHGFPEESLPLVFDRFYRADPSRTRQATASEASRPSNRTGQSAGSPNQQRLQTESTLLNSGNGLGLAIVQQIIDAHRGSVTAGNHPDTGGGWLQVFLPIQNESP